MSTEKNSGGKNSGYNKLLLLLYDHTQTVSKGTVAE
jgi:hypothetical protein